MYCDQCGAPLVGDPRFCRSCGKALGNVAVITTESRLSRHLRLLGILWIAAGALNVLAAGSAWLAGRIILPPLVSRGVPGFVPMLVSSIAVLVLCKAIACFAAGWGLLERESWARLLAIILAIISLFNVPFGTALGIYTMWVLLPAQAGEEYGRMARAA
jgi:hypothetical protein